MGRVGERIAGQADHQSGLASGSPRAQHISRHRAERSEDEVTDSNVAGVDQRPRRVGRSDGAPQMALADIGADGVRGEPDQRATATIPAVVPPGRAPSRTPAHTATTGGRRATTGSTPMPASVPGAGGAGSSSVAVAAAAAAAAARPIVGSAWCRRGSATTARSMGSHDARDTAARRIRHVPIIAFSDQARRADVAGFDSAPIRYRDNPFEVCAPALAPPLTLRPEKV